MREFALYGETTGESDEFGLPVRADWAAAYRGKTAVVWPYAGCLGGRLTGLRWPERELVEVPAEKAWFEPMRPLGGSGLGKPAPADADGVLDYQDVSGRRWIETERKDKVVFPEENASAAPEVMSRMARPSQRPISATMPA